MSLIQEALNKAGSSINPDEMIEKKPARVTFDEVKQQPAKSPIIDLMAREETFLKNIKKEKLPQSEKKKTTISPWLYAFGFLSVAILSYFLFFRSVTLTPENIATTSLTQVEKNVTVPAPEIVSSTLPEVKEVEKQVKEPVFEQVMNKINFSKKTPKIVTPPVQSLSSYQFVLTGITVSGDERLALIDNQVVGVGDILRSDVRVHEISTRNVVLEKNGRLLTLRL